MRLRDPLAQWVGACGVRLAPLAEAMKAALLTRTVLHAEETPVPMLKPGLGRTHRAYLWSYATSEYDDLKTVIYDFADDRAGVYAREFLGDWTGKLVCDDYSGYKAFFERGVIEIRCPAHARRKLHDLYANHGSEIAEEGLSKLNGHDPYRYLKDVLERLPTQRARGLEELMPHRWVRGGLA